MTEWHDDQALPEFIPSDYQPVNPGDGRILHLRERCMECGADEVYAVVGGDGRADSSTWCSSCEEKERDPVYRIWQDVAQHIPFEDFGELVDTLSANQSAVWIDLKQLIELRLGQRLRAKIMSEDSPMTAELSDVMPTKP